MVMGATGAVAITVEAATTVVATAAAAAANRIQIINKKGPFAKAGGPFLLAALLEPGSTASIINQCYCEITHLH